MKSLLTCLTIAIVLSGCASPGVTVYGDAQSDLKGKLQNSKLVAINADVIGDINVPGRLAITTPRDPNGNVLVARTAILSKDKTTVIGYNEEPMVAQIKTTPVYVAFFRGGQSWLNSVGTSVVSALGFGVGAQAVGPAAAAIKP